MKRIFLAVMATLFMTFASTSAFAGLNEDAVRSAGFKDLSEAEKAEVIKMVADKAAGKQGQGVLEKVTEKVVPSAETADKWLNVGERFGKMIGGAAREVGVAVNEFVKSPVGMLTAGLIVWNYMGGMIVHVVGGVLVLAVGLGYLNWMMRRTIAWEYKYDPERKNIFGNPVLISKKRGELSGDALAGYSIGGAVVMIVAIAVAFSY